MICQHPAGCSHRLRSPDACFCAPGATGHVHASRLSAGEWAMGVQAIAQLAGPAGAYLPWLDGLPKATVQAERILSRPIQGELF